MRDEELARDVARPHAHHGQLDDAPAHVVRKGPAVDEHAAKLVHSGLTCERDFYRSVTVRHLKGAPIIRIIASSCHNILLQECLMPCLMPCFRMLSYSTYAFLTYYMQAMSQAFISCSTNTVLHITGKQNIR